MFQKEAPEKTEKGKESRKGREVEDEEGSAPPPQCTAIAWISDKYFGTPLQVRAKDLADWSEGKLEIDLGHSWPTNGLASWPTGWRGTTSLLSNWTPLKRWIVTQESENSALEVKVGYEDVHPSFIAISWEGMDYDSPLRDRTRICREFIDFIVTLRL